MSNAEELKLAMPLPTKKRPGRATRVAVCVAAYQAPRVFATAVAAYRTMGWKIYAHLDAKIDLGAYRAEMGNAISQVNFIPNRVCIFWSGMSQVDAQFRLFDAALDGRADRIVYLADDTIPIRSLNEIADAVATNGDQMHHYHFAPDHPAAIRYQSFAIPDHRATNQRGGTLREVDTAFFDLAAECDGPRRLGKKRLDIWWGLGYRVLTAKTVRKLMMIARNDPHLWASFKFSRMPEETLIPMVVANYIRPLRRYEGPVFMDFSKGHGPLIYRSASDLPVDIPANCLFARTFAPDAWAACEAMVDALRVGVRLAA